jgi:uncharacterized membrane protein YgcG
MTRIPILLHVTVLLTILLALPGVVDAQESRDFPVPTGLVTDMAGVFSGEQVTALEELIGRANVATGLDGRVVIVPGTEEWYLDEYTKDYGDWMQGQGIIQPTGWLIYISTVDRKFSLAVQDGAVGNLTPGRRREILLILGESLQAGDIYGAAVKAVEEIGKLPGIQTKNKGKFSSNVLIFIGLAVVLFTLMMRQRRSGKAVSTRQ